VSLSGIGGGFCFQVLGGFEFVALTIYRQSAGLGAGSSRMYVLLASDI
jgi:hypothetical protein